jgi:hypothetical protein
MLCLCLAFLLMVASFWAEAVVMAVLIDPETGKKWLASFRTEAVVMAVLINPESRLGSGMSVSTSPSFSYCHHLQALIRIHTGGFADFCL